MWRLRDSDGAAEPVWSEGDCGDTPWPFQVPGASVPAGISEQEGFASRGATGCVNSSKIMAEVEVST